MLYVSLLPLLKESPEPEPPDPGPPSPVSNANCYDFSSGDEVDVDSMAKLAAAVKSAPEGGRQVRVAPGKYAGGRLTLDRSGSRPVVIRPREGAKSVTIEAPTWTIAPGSSRIVIAGFQMTNPEITVNGSHHRITRCGMSDLDRFAIHLLAATDFRADHCDVTAFHSSSRRKAFVRLDGVSVGKKQCRDVLVDRNYIHHSTPAIGGNGSEFIGLHSSASSAWVDPGLVIDSNLFEDLSIPGEGELIGAKCSGIKFRFNTMLRTKNPYINAPRMAENMEMRSNWFEGTTSEPVHIFGRGLLIGNRFMGALKCWIAPGDFYWRGKVDVGYVASDGSRAIGNRMGSGYIQVGGYWSTRKAKVPARKTNLWGNTRDAGGDAYQLLDGRHVETTFRKDDEPYKPAVKLTPADVGLAAPDPLCRL